MTLYRPAYFQVKDDALVRDVIRQHPFATLICPHTDEATVTHLPLLIKQTHSSEIVLVGHLAARNPQAEDIRAGRPIIAIFLGPHAYVSPLWYENPAEVPTLNYIAVHAHGRPETITDRNRAVQYFDQLSEFYEASHDPRWSLQYLTEDFISRMLEEIVVFELPVTNLEAKFKLSQNRKAADRARVRETLAASGDSSDHQIAQWMKRLGIGE